VVSSNGGMGQRFLHSPNSTPKRESLGGSLSFHQSVSYSTASNQSAVTEVLSHNARNSVKMDSDVMELMEDEQVAIAQAKVTSMSRISRGYNKRKYKEMPSPQILYHCNSEQRESLSVSSQNGRRSQSGRSSFASESKRSSASRSPRSPPTKTKKKGYFFESKSRGSKKLAKIIGK